MGALSRDGVTFQANPAAMFKRVALALSLAVLLVGCKQTTPGPAAFVGQGNTAVNDTQIVSSSDSNPTLAGTSINYIIMKITFTNDYNVDMTPQINKFILTDTSGKRYTATDQGSSALTGISNYAGILKKGDKHDYTIAFRGQNGTLNGTVGYEP